VGELLVDTQQGKETLAPHENVSTAPREVAGFLHNIISKLVPLRKKFTGDTGTDYGQTGDHLSNFKEKTRGKLGQTYWQKMIHP